MKRTLNLFRKLLFPPADGSRWVRLAPYGVMIVLFTVFIIASAYTWEYTNSPEFCGMTCHSMPPEYSAYQLSPHAQVKCVECHIGREAIGNQFTRKLGDFRHVIAATFKTYQYPLKVKSLRPASEICERCHSPEKFSDDSQRVIVHYDSDVENTFYRTYLLLKTGGGTARQGLGRGIHWHIENQVLFYATDENEQEIPYVQIVDPENGADIEYVDVSADFDPYSLDESQLREMDCVTCHNRISHSIYKPEESVDQALFRKIISPDIPEIRRKAVEVLWASYDSNEQAIRDISTLPEFYQENYPDVYDRRSEELNKIVDVLQEIYTQSIFRDQKVDWNTHPNNMGHETDPGCFRCHDGKHLSGSGEAIRLECNLCHAIPTISGPDDTVTTIEINQSIQPSTHRNPNWIALHRFVYDENNDETCTSCHDTTNYGLADDSSFCANSACHAGSAEFLDLTALDAPEIREIMLQQLPHYPKNLPPIAGWDDARNLDTIHQKRDCEDCHDPFPPVGPPPDQVCIDCHGGTREDVVALTAGLEPNPHNGHEGGATCSYCHKNFGPYRSPCSLCHENVALVPIDEAASNK